MSIIDEMLKTPPMHKETNLFEETAEVLVANGKTWADVRWVGTPDGEYAVTDPNAISDLLNVDYDDGFGIEEIAIDLVVVGADWWLERHEYDGSEWWEFKSTPELSTHPKAFKVLSRRQCGEGSYYGTNTIEAMNDVRPTR